MPINVNDTVEYPAFIKHALRDLISNKYKIPNIVLTQPKPAKKPAIAPNTKSASAPINSL